MICWQRSQSYANDLLLERDKCARTACRGCICGTTKIKNEKLKTKSFNENKNTKKKADAEKSKLDVDHSRISSPVPSSASTRHSINIVSHAAESGFSDIRVTLLFLANQREYTRHTASESGSLAFKID